MTHDTTTLVDDLAAVRATLETALAQVAHLQAAVCEVDSDAGEHPPVQERTDDDLPALLRATQAAVRSDWGMHGVRLSTIRRLATEHGAPLPQKTDRTHRALAALLGELPEPTVRVGQSLAYPRLPMWAAVNSWYSDRDRAVPWHAWQASDVRHWCELLPLIAAVVDGGVDSADRDAVLTAVRDRGGRVPHSCRAMVLDAARPHAAHRWPWMPVTT